MVNEKSKVVGRAVSWWDTLRVRMLRAGSRRHTLFVSALVGVLCGLAASLLKMTVHFTANLVQQVVQGPVEGLLYWVLPAFGILMTVLLLRYVIRDNISHGVPRVLYALSRNQGRIKGHHMWSSIVCSTLTIGFGGSVGAESPIVQTGAAIGSNVGRLFRVDKKTLTLMLGCGAAGGVAAIFNAPLAGMVFTLEVLMLDMTMSSIVPLLVSAVSATLVSAFIQGSSPLFRFSYSVPFDLVNWPYYVILGVFTGFISIYFTRVAMAMGGRFARIKHPYLRYAIGATGLGALLYLFPPLYGEGYESVQLLFEGRVEELFATSPLGSLFTSEWMLFLGLGLMLLLKVVAMSFTTGAGGIGGSFAPSLFVGGVGGFLLGRLLNTWFALGLGEANFVLVGMAGSMAGVMHAPLLGIFLIAELTEGYALLVPLMITATTSFITVTNFQKHSIYTAQLAAQGDLITHHKDRAVLTMLQLSRVVETDLITVSPKDTLGELVKVVARSRRNIFPVIDERRRFLGIVLLDTIREVMFDPDKYTEYTVRDFMTSPPAVISITDPMERVMAKFEESGAWNLPVVSAEGYVGFVSKATIFSAYREVLVQFSNE